MKGYTSDFRITRGQTRYGTFQKDVHLSLIAALVLVMILVASPWIGMIISYLMIIIIIGIAAGFTIYMLNKLFIADKVKLLFKKSY